MAPPSLLLGPPELKNSPKSDSSYPVDADYYGEATTVRPPMGFTENGAPTFVSSGNPCLDLFFHVVPDTPASYLNQQLPLAWSHDALTTLKLICNLRGVRGTGKSDKQNFYTAAIWLHNHHPKTLACNLFSFAEFGYFKDLPEILYRLLEGPNVRAIQKSQWLERKSSVVGVLSRGRFKRTKTEKPKEPRVPKVKKLTGAERARLEKENVRASRKEKFLAMAKKAVERYQRDPDYQFLHERVSDLFAECLKSDIEHLNSDKQPKKISLAAKWCPSIDSSFDRATLICECIAKKVFSRESCIEYQELEEEHYAYRVRDRLRKEVLVPLRKALELPEVYMSATQWGLIPYNRVASVAMKLYKDKFLKHDRERFGKYLADVKAGKSTIAAGALLPHEIIASLNIDSYMVYRYMDSDDEDRVQDDGGCQVAKLQWKRMVDDLLRQGKLRNSLAVCDVSGSMNGDPMDVSVALGLLLSELSADPWKGNVITFSASPKLHLIEWDDLRAKCAFMRDMDWGDNTNSQKVFDLLLEVAVKGNLKPEDMIKRVFVFSDMEFDESSATGNDWETDYEAIKRKFEERGYGNAVPQIVFWNLRHSEATPAPSNQPGVAFLSGFSKNLIKMFMDNDGEIRPDRIMEAAISGEEYQRLVLVD
ncbi:hypothetical protein ACFX16_005224 [Malus domestica]